jgi:hypothetical protein
MRIKPLFGKEIKYDKISLVPGYNETGEMFLAIFKYEGVATSAPVLVARKPLDLEMKTTAVEWVEWFLTQDVFVGIYDPMFPIFMDVSQTCASATTVKKIAELFIDILSTSIPSNTPVTPSPQRWVDVRDCPKCQSPKGVLCRTPLCAQLGLVTN